MDTTRAEQIALDDALVAPANCLNIGNSNFQLSLDLKSKEATLQVVYDVLKLTPFYKAFQISADILEIYMQEEMLQICPKLPNQQFEELPFEEAILTFLRDLSRSGEIKMITDVNVNKLHQPWRSFAVIINKCLSGKVPDMTVFDYLRNSESFKEYYANASGAEPPKTKASVKKKQIGSDTTTTSSTTKGKRLKTSAKTVKPAKKKQPAKTSIDKGLTVGSGADEGTGSLPGVPDVPTYDSDDEQISWNSSEEDNNDEVNVSKDDDTDNDDDDNDDDDNDDDVDKNINDDDADNQDDDNQDDDDQEHDDQDDEANDDAQDKDDQDDENQDDDNEQNGFRQQCFDPRVQTPLHVESTDDEDDNEEVQGVNIEGEEIDEEENNKERC
ncbi:hypothetical protein Tco_1495227 [Tanacetum coccineum]